MSFALILIGLIAIGVANPVIGVVIAGGLWAIWRNEPDHETESDESDSD